MAGNNLLALKFSFSALRTPFMVWQVAHSKINEWNALRGRDGQEQVIGTLAILHEVTVPSKEDVRVSVKFEVRQNGHDADYYLEALKELGKIFAKHYQLERPPVVTGYPEN